jgi:hypothetical protein
VAWILQITREWRVLNTFFFQSSRCARTSIDTGDNADSNNATTTATSEPTATSSSAPLVSATTAADASFGGSFVISGGLDLSASATGYPIFHLVYRSKTLTPPRRQILRNLRRL